MLKRTFRPRQLNTLEHFRVVRIPRLCVFMASRCCRSRVLKVSHSIRYCWCAQSRACTEMIVRLCPLDGCRSLTDAFACVQVFVLSAVGGMASCMCVVMMTALVDLHQHVQASRARVLADWSCCHRPPDCWSAAIVFVAQMESLPDHDRDLRYRPGISGKESPLCLL